MNTIFSRFDSLPEFLRTYDLVKLGLYPTIRALCAARARGEGPDFIKINRKILYPKISVISFLEHHMKDHKKMG